eukprot:CAMPEP_0197416744 /NCGR_PEP_ID=MMETSP1170-20131217/2970_1 /TAXON_ID=54406 /ORGANISM="Sarcinochrysis sp, Strain CCMP770" /LENGTH=268 /DNA_ID=CAMNT_0042943661 /DNA_START=47 /DNA_END=854 /DNA_ORIENTATION=-
MTYDDPATKKIEGEVVTQAPVVTQGVVAQGPVVTQGVVLDLHKDDDAWPSEFCCWDNCGCNKDCGLWCYTCCCPMCVYAEIMAAIEEPTCCCQVGFCPSLACVLSIGFASWILQHAMTAFGLYLCSPFVNIVPCVTCGGRQSLNYKYGLPINDCCCPCFAHYCCQTCALYQEIVYVKHVLKKEPTCCCYKNCCNESGACCPGTEPGGYSGIVTEQPVLVVSQQPADARRELPVVASAKTEEIELSDDETRCSHKPARSLRADEDTAPL